MTQSLPQGGSWWIGTHTREQFDALVVRELERMNAGPGARWVDVISGAGKSPKPTPKSIRWGGGRR